VYAPSGAEKKREREAFFTHDVPKLIIQTTPTEIVLAGDFNCILDSKDSSTWHKNYSRALGNMINILELCDVWTSTNSVSGYTYYSSRNAPLLGRIYVNKHLYKRKKQ
jgi:exonuclease III